MAPGCTALGGICLGARISATLTVQWEGDHVEGHQNISCLALAGCGVAMFMLFTGWIVIAETWFEAWRSDLLRDIALGSAFRYCGMIGVMALFVGARDD